MTLWEIDIHPAKDQPDRAGARIASAARELGLAPNLSVAAARGYLVQGESLERGQIERLARELLADVVVERTVIGHAGEPHLSEPSDCGLRIADCGLTDRSSNPKFEIRNPKSVVTVLLKPGVMDPVAQSAQAAAADLGIKVEAVATLHKYWIGNATPAEIKAVSERLLANDAI